MKRSSASTLPHDVIVEILLRLPASSILRFRAASQQWRACTMRPSFVRDQARRSPPAVVFQRPGSGRIYLFNGDNKHVPKPRSINDDVSLPPLTLEWSCDDSLLFSVYGDRRNYYAYDLIKRQWAATPETAAAAAFGFLAGFYSHPASGEHRVLRGVVQETDEQIKQHGFEVAAMGATTWRRIKTAPSHDDLRLFEIRSNEHPVAARGRLHWCNTCTVNLYKFGHDKDKEKSIVVFDINTEEFSWMALPGTLNYGCNCLFEMNGELMLCQVTSATNMLVWVRQDSSWAVRTAISTTHLVQKNVALNHISELHPLGLRSKDELLLRRCGGSPYVFDFKSNTLKLVESCTDIEPWYAPTKESIALYDAFERADWLNGKEFVVF